jgi:uncharacterized protein (TIGR03437 family)
MRTFRSNRLLRTSSLAFAVLAASPAFLPAQTPARYRIPAGGSSNVASPLTGDFLRDAKTQRLTIHGPSDRGIVILPAPDGAIAVASSLTAIPGDYVVELEADNRIARFAVTIDPLRPVPSGAARPPVILLNGYQFFCNASTANPRSSDTFGDLESSLLRAGAPSVYFFDNCAEGTRTAIEDLGEALRQALDAIKYDNGAPVPQVDLVAHSMGGLIVRSYLAGMHTDGSFSPPASPRVRKFVQIATPNFGSYFAAAYSGLLSDVQARAMLPGSTFLWNLATWNQYGDDLRGVDTLAIAGNRGILPQLNASDGIVSLTSASLSFTREQSRTRLLPYCHTEIPALAAAFIRVDCTGPSIAKAAETATLVNSFLQDTVDWRSSTLSKTPAADPYLAQFGGAFFRVQNAAGQYSTDLTSVSFGSVTLTLGPAAGIAYAEFLRGTDTFRAVAASANADCGPLQQPAGYVAIVRCKAGPVITSVGSPAAASPLGRVVQPGFPFLVSGSGFGAQRCGTCGVSLNGIDLEIVSWADTSVVARLPAAAQGRVEIALRTGAGADRTSIMAATPAIAADSIVNGASFQTGFAPGGWLTISGSHLSRTTRTWAAADFVNGNPPTSLDGVSVKINGVPAVVYYISPGQLNVLAPSTDTDTLASEIAGVEVAAPDGVVRASALKLRYAPATFIVGEKYAAAVNLDGSVAAPANSIPGFPTRPARPGEVLQLYVTGLGTGTTPSAAVTVGGADAPVSFTGLVAPGLYQINFTVPQVTAGDQPLAIRVAGVAGQNTGWISVGQ